MRETTLFFWFFVFVASLSAFAIYIDPADSNIQNDLEVSKKNNESCNAVLVPNYHGIPAAEVCNKEASTLFSINRLYDSIE